MTVSVALIVKNEERTLGRCLDSLYGAVDEIIVVDTGSMDATKTVARRYTDRLFDFAWCQDFAAARQFASDQATGDWVMWVDADDVVLGAEHIKPLAENAPADVGAFYWRYVTDRDAWGNPRCVFWRERCVRNDGTFRWAGRVHEVLVPQRPWATVRSPDVVVEHHSEEGRAPEKLRRNLDILEAEYAVSGDSPSSRLLFYLGREYASAGNTAKAVATLLQYLRLAAWDDERYLAQTQVAELYRVQKRYDQAINADLQALKTCPHWPDAYFGLAKTYYFLKDWYKVIHWTEVGRAMPQPDTIHITNPLDYRYNWIIYYTNALFHVGEVQEAQAWTQWALEICPDDPWHQENSLFFARSLQAARETKEDSSCTVQPYVVSPARLETRRLARQRPLRVVWEGPQFFRSSLGLVNRELCSALLRTSRLDGSGPVGNGATMAGCPAEWSLKPELPVEFGPEEDPERLQALASHFHAPLSGPADVHVRHQWPPNFKWPSMGRWIIMQPWEYTSIPRSWFDLFQNHVDEVWVPSQYVWRCYVDNGISPDKVHVIPHGVNRQLFNPGVVPLPLPTRKTFKLLFVGGTLWRKGIDVLLDAYVQAFRRQDDVSLVIKDVGANSYYRAHTACERILQLQSDVHAPEIVYLTEDLTDRDITRIYTACDCLVHPYRGEGFALPVAEAMACSRPVIVTQGGACDDYCTDDTACLVPAQLTPTTLWEETVGQSGVLEPDKSVLIHWLRYVYEHRDEARRKGTRASEHILTHFTWERAAQAVLDRLMHLCDSPGRPVTGVPEFPMQTMPRRAEQMVSI